MDEAMNGLRNAAEALMINRQNAIRTQDPLAEAFTTARAHANGMAVLVSANASAEQRDQIQSRIQLASANGYRSIIGTGRGANRGRGRDTSG